MANIPGDAKTDNTLTFLSEGYNFIGNRCKQYGSDVFETRLLMRRAICARGREAAEVFYTPDRFTRRGAIPPTTVKLLQGRKSVQSLSDDAHRQRKATFLALLDEAHVESLVAATAGYWTERVAAWQPGKPVVLFDEIAEVLCRAVCDWAGVPLAEEDVSRHTRAFVAMIEGAGKVGPRNWAALLRRLRTERWITALIDDIRNGMARVPEDKPAAIIARYEEDGAPLDSHLAAVELINLLRPTVAVAHYAVFAALALHEYPAERRALEVGDAEDMTRFVHEVRRFYPFFPLIAGRARTAFDWRGRTFPEGTWFLLDLYGTNHDPSLWEEPEVFRPDRFENRDITAFDLIPQGAGDDRTDHRCPGEPATVALTAEITRLLLATPYDVPPQDVFIDLSQMPALPASRFIIVPKPDRAEGP